MRKFAHRITAGSALAALLGTLMLTTSAVAADAAAPSAAEQGKAIAFDSKRGNCLACHEVEGSELPGNIGPTLAAIKERYSKETLKAQIVDARKKNPTTMMPPFGRHAILSDDEINKVVEFIYTL